ncbi:MAG: hypothetical protein FJW23_07410 [Acidimicrobiia bacterium]|nr:hypothetical protein [Acidimicrobiia bacterium]
MQSFIDPAADAIWASVATVITEEGTTHVRPDSDDEWKALRREALLLVEATNLLLMDGREVGRAGPGPADLGIELESAEIRTLIDQDPGGWTRSVSGLYEVAVSILEAVNARDADRLFERGASLDRACEQCHSQFWYPE